MEQKKRKTIREWIKHAWSNYVVRNIVLAVSLLVICLFLASILLNFFTRHNNYKDVPDLSNITVKEAEKLARKSGRLRVEINDSLFVPLFDPGVILEQNPEPGTKVKPGRRIYVTVNSSRQKIVDVPYVTGYSLRQAKNIIESAGLEIDRLVYVSDIATNNVLEQRVDGKTVKSNGTVRAEVGTGITLVVGRSPGAALVSIPRVVGLPLREAKSRLWDAGLNIGKVDMEDDIDLRNLRQARVYRQTPDQGRRVALGTDVTIYLSLDSLTIATGARRSDTQGGSRALREAFLHDSLSNEGYEGDRLKQEVDWLIRLENGEIRPDEQRPRSAEELIQEALEEMGGAMESGSNGGIDRSEDDVFF